MREGADYKNCKLQENDYLRSRDSQEEEKVPKGSKLSSASEETTEEENEEEVF